VCLAHIGPWGSAWSDTRPGPRTARGFVERAQPLGEFAAHQRVGPNGVQPLEKWATDPIERGQAGWTVKTLAEVITHSPEETVAFGRELAKELRPPCLALLEGELGSGKTTLVKGIVAGLGAGREEDVTSPSFTLVHEYGLPAAVRQPTEAEPARFDSAHRRERVEGQAGSSGKVYHVDLYRIEDARELATLGLEDLAGQDATVLVEWGEKLAGSVPIPAGGIRIRMEHLGSEDRRITVERLEA